jgi:hypothetical protein
MKSLVLCLLLAGCATAPIETQTVDVPIPVHCRPDLGPEPSYPDTDAALQAAPDLFVSVRLLLEGRLMRIQRDLEQSAALTACE